MVTQTCFATDTFSLKSFVNGFIAFLDQHAYATVVLAEVDVLFQMYNILPQLRSSMIVMQ
jgi:hypothetical protein